MRARGILGLTVAGLAAFGASHLNLGAQSAQQADAFVARGTEGLFRAIAARKGTIAPDAIGTNPKALKFRALDDHH